MPTDTPFCQVCGGTRLRHLFNKGGHPYQICDDCGLVRIYPQLTDEELARIYHQGYYEHWGGREAAFHQMKSLTFGTLLDRFIVPRVTGSGARLLDIGAATGIMMEQAHERGFEVYGVEAARDGAAIIAGKFGRDHIVNDYFGEKDFWAPGFFDVICMSDLFEHVRDPRGVMSKVHDLLRPGGYLIMILPDTDSWSGRILGRHWSQFIPEHLFSFSRKNIRILLEQHGLAVEHIGPGKKHLTIDYAGNVWTFMGGPVDRLAAAICRLVPRRLATRPWSVHCGEMTVLARKASLE